MATLKEARSAKAGLKKILADVPEVLGVGIGKSEGDYHLKVNLRELTTVVPDEFDRVQVVVEVMGPIVVRT